MRIEDLSLSAFIAGTAIGYLIWYWARGGGEIRELRKPQFQVTATLVCALILVILFFALGDDTVFTPNLRIVTITLFAVILAGLFAILVRAWATSHGTTEPYTKVFQTTIGIVFSFILAMFVFILIWGPHSLYLHTYDRWIATVPLGALLLGFLFGSIGAEWLNYILVPGALRTVALESAHKRWGFVLVTLLILGLLYPLFPQLLSKLNSANVTTPLGTVSFTVQPISTIRSDQPGENTGDELSESRIWDALKDLKLLADRDQKYGNLFYRTKTRQLAALNELHEKSNNFVEKVLQPLGMCLDEHFARFHNLEHFSIRLGVARVCEISCAFVFGNLFEKGGDGVPQLFGSARLHFA